MPESEARIAVLENKIFNTDKWLKDFQQEQRQFNKEQSEKLDKMMEIVYKQQSNVKWISSVISLGIGGIGRLAGYFINQK